MAAARKLQQEAEKLIKTVDEHSEAFDEGETNKMIFKLINLIILCLNFIVIGRSQNHWLRIFWMLPPPRRFFCCNSTNDNIISYLCYLKIIFVWY